MQNICNVGPLRKADGEMTRFQLLRNYLTKRVNNGQSRKEEVLPEIMPILLKKTKLFLAELLSGKKLNGEI